ncbi:MAG: glycosyltransferase [Leifsonia sp.]
MNTASPSPKVTVIVPTYATGDALGRVMSSLDGQLLPAADFEVIFVDDGSPDDTHARLLEFASTRANVRVERIENSGWPSAPRNLGVGIARGEYVLFLDHDDELYPNALSAAYDWATRTGADVVNGKEARTDQSKWALPTYRANFENAVGRTDVHPLVPTNPHKLYRTAFLREHGIRFPEGRRAIWEDVFFNIDVARHATRIAIMADEPFYHWVRGANTSSSGYTDDQAEWWSALQRIFEYIDERLDGDVHAFQRRQLMMEQYRSRLLPALGAGLRSRPPADRAIALTTAEHIIREHIPAAWDAELARHLQARAHLIRTGRADLVTSLGRYDVDITGKAFCTGISVDDGLIEVRIKTTWFTAQHGFLDLMPSSGRVLRSLSPELQDALPIELLDVTEDLLAAQVTLGVRSRRDAITWLAPTTTQVSIADSTAYPDVTAQSVAVIDPERVAIGRALASGRWDLHARTELFGVLNQRGVRSAHPTVVGRFDRGTIDVPATSSGAIGFTLRGR